jgi:hypothetical protein
MAVVLLRIRKLCISVALCVAASSDHSAAVMKIRLPLHPSLVFVLVCRSDAMQQRNLPYWMLRPRHVEGLDPRSFVQSVASAR